MYVYANTAAVAEARASARGLCNQREKCKFAPTCAYQKSNSSPSAVHVYLLFELKAEHTFQTEKWATAIHDLFCGQLPAVAASFLSARSVCLYVSVAESVLSDASLSLSLKSWPSCLSPARDYRRSSRDSSPDDRRPTGPLLCTQFVHSLLFSAFIRMKCVRFPLMLDQSKRQCRVHAQMGKVENGFLYRTIRNESTELFRSKKNCSITQIVLSISEPVFFLSRLLVDWTTRSNTFLSSSQIFWESLVFISY